MDMSNKLEEVQMEDTVVFGGYKIPKRLISPNGTVYEWDADGRRWISSDGLFLRLEIDLVAVVSIVNDPGESGMICQCCYPEAY